MKYLKRFNESNYEDIKDFCETSLAYLVDKGYDVKVVKVGKNQNEYFHITIKYQYGVNEPKKEKRWVEIKDLFIPFYKILTRRYTILQLLTGGRRYQWGKNLYSPMAGENPGDASIVIDDLSDSQIVTQITIDIV
jgi:hypothetical protein